MEIGGLFLDIPLLLGILLGLLYPLAYLLRFYKNRKALREAQDAAPEVPPENPAEGDPDPRSPDRDISLDRWVRIYRAQDNAEAHVMRSFLESHGIPCFLKGDQHRSLLGWVGGVLIPVDLWVPEDEAGRAEELVRPNSLESESSPKKQ